jgi:hypothetical protein
MALQPGVGLGLHYNTSPNLSIPCCNNNNNNNNKVIYLVNWKWRVARWHWLQWFTVASLKIRHLCRWVALIHVYPHLEGSWRLKATYWGEGGKDNCCWEQSNESLLEQFDRGDGSKIFNLNFRKSFTINTGWYKKKGRFWKTQQKLNKFKPVKHFLWRQHAVDRSTDPWLLNVEVVCSSRSLFRIAANCTWLPPRISKVPLRSISEDVGVFFKSPLWESSNLSCLFLIKYANFLHFV